MVRIGGLRNGLRKRSGILTLAAAGRMLEKIGWCLSRTEILADLFWGLFVSEGTVPDFLSMNSLQAKEPPRCRGPHWRHFPQRKAATADVIPLWRDWHVVASRGYQRRTSSIIKSFHSFAFLSRNAIDCSTHTTLTMTEEHVHFIPRDTVYGFTPEEFDPANLPDVDHEFLDSHDLIAFEKALQAPDPLQSPVEEAGSRSPRSPSSFSLTKRDSQVEGHVDNDVAAVTAAAGAASGDLPVPAAPSQGTFITAQNDWAPVNPRVYGRKRGSKKKRKRRGKGAVEGLLGTRTKDETREGYLYQLLKWPLLFFVIAWLAWLGIAYLSTRLYIWVFEHFFTWRGQRQRLRRNMRQTSTYRDWVTAAKELDGYLGRQTWKEENDFAYYDSKTVSKVWDQLRKTRARVEEQEKLGEKDDGGKAVAELKALIEACVKNDFVGVENPRLYSQTYFGTKNLVQNFLDEGK